jgi:hypothetical protein
VGQVGACLDYAAPFAESGRGEPIHVIDHNQQRPLEVTKRLDQLGTSLFKTLPCLRGSCLEEGGESAREAAERPRTAKTSAAIEHAQRTALS